MFGIVNSLCSIVADPELYLEISAAYSIVVVCWTILFMETWSRKQSELAFIWGTESFELEERPRRRFAHSKDVSWRIDPVTGDLAPFRKSKWTKVVRMLLTTSIVLGCIGVVLVVVVISHMIKEMDEEFGDWSDFAGSGFNVAAILILGKLFSPLANWLTEWENHRTQTQVSARNKSADAC